VLRWRWGSLHLPRRG